MVTRPDNFAQRQAVAAGVCAAALAMVFAGMAALGNLAESVVAAIVLGLAAGAVYFVALFALERASEHQAAFWVILGGGLLFRALLLPVPATLSADVQRYRWEGSVQLEGWNPYAIEPADPRVAHLRSEGWSVMPGREVPTVYPPLLELAFRETSRWVERFPMEHRTTLYKLPFVAGDVAVLGLLAWWLRRTGGRNAQLAVYAWNPLVIVEFSGSGHMDPLAMAALLGAVLLLARQRAALSTVTLGCAALLKVYPLVLAPLWLRGAGWPRRVQAWAGVAGAVGLGWLSWWPFRGAEGRLLESLAYVESRWRLNNASLYALLLRASGSHDLAAGVALGVVAGLALWAAARNVPPERAAILLIAVLLLFSANAFPWYFTWAVPLLCMAPLGRFSLAWLLLTVTQFVSYHVLIRYQTLGEWHFQPAFLLLTYAPPALLLLILWRVNPPAPKPSM